MSHTQIWAKLIAEEAEQTSKIWYHASWVGSIIRKTKAGGGAEGAPGIWATTLSICLMWTAWNLIILAEMVSLENLAIRHILIGATKQTNIQIKSSQRFLLEYVRCGPIEIMSFVAKVALDSIAFWLVEE